MDITNNEILRTIELLDTSVSTHRRSVLREKEISTRQLMDNRRRDRSELSALLSPSGRRGVGDLSLTLPQHDLTVLHTIAPQEDSVYESNCVDQLFTLFLESLQQHATDRKVFDIVLALIQNCNNAIELAKENWKRKVDINLKELSWLVDERNTWRLLYCLYQNRLSSHQDEVRIGPPRKRSEKEIAEDLFENDAVVREYQLVVDWLEQNALDQNADDQNNVVKVQYFTDKTVNWENTLHCLQNNKRDIPYRGPEDIVTEVDPDAPIRQKKKLHTLDEKDDSFLEKALFAQIRSGNLDTAQSLCRQCGCFWRAALLEGWRLYHDPNYGDTSVDDDSAIKKKKPAEGNYRRDLWKRMTWEIIETKQLRPTMNAVLGAFCGHLKSLIDVSQSWADMLWAHMRVVVDIKVEKEIRVTSSRKYEPMPEDYWENAKSVKDIFMDLASSDIPRVRTTATEPMCVVQQMLITNEIAALMTQIGGWISSSQPQFLRFVAHLVLFFRMAGVSECDSIEDSVIVEYIKVLMKRREPSLVAYYVSLLPQDDQIVLYSMFLQTVVQQKVKVECLAVGQTAGLDILAITKATVESIRRKADSELDLGLQPEETPQDLEKVAALDWLIVYPEQRFELLWQANAIMRQFIASGNLETAHKAFSKIPGDTIDLLVHEYNTAETAKPFSYADVNALLPPQVAEACREYLCISAYLDAEEAFSNWIEHFYNARPKPPMQPGVHASFAEKIAFEQRENVYKTEMDRWRTLMLQQTKAVRDKLINILTFPSGGWMVDSGSFDKWALDEELLEEAKLRKQQMDCLRQLCIPKVALLLHALHHKVGDYRECIQLAELVVDEHYGLFKVYPTEGLQNLLTKICESSLELLHQKKDPWGLPVTS